MIDSPGVALPGVAQPGVAQPRVAQPSVLEQAKALLWLRVTLWKRRLIQQRQWGRLILTVLFLLLGLAFSVSISFLLVDAAHELANDPASLAQRGGPLAIFATWLSMALAGRLWFALLPRGQTGSFIDPRRFAIYAVPPRLISAMNFAAQLLEPVWLFFWPPLIALAWVIGKIPGAPKAWALLIAEAGAVWAVAGLLHLGGAVAGAFDARPFLRRGFSVVLVFAGFSAFQLSLARPGRPGMAALFAGHHWQLIALTPPGWAAVLAQSLSEGRPLHALTPALLLFLAGALSGVLAHRLSTREAVRPQETVEAPGSAKRAAGWKLPFVSGAFSAILEKEVKTVVRVGWLQIVLVPVGYLMLRTFSPGARAPGGEPLLFAAAYAHLGVLEIATNAFGRDVGAARAYFLWPVSHRALLAAKNTVAYVFSLAIFLGILAVAIYSAPVTFAQAATGFIAHAAIFPLLATVGNVSSVLWASPIRGARLRSARGAGPVGARFLAIGLLGGAAWAPYWLSQVSGLPQAALYLGELVAMSIAYGGLLAFAAHLLEAKKGPLLLALAMDE